MYPHTIHPVAGPSGDEEEFCTGSSNDCPADIYRDKAKGFKCGRDCYFW
jgi:hypothetical protein